MGVNAGRQMEFFWEIFNWNLTQICGMGFGQKSPIGPLACSGSARRGDLVAEPGNFANAMAIPFVNVAT